MMRSGKTSPVRLCFFMAFCLFSTALSADVILSPHSRQAIPTGLILARLGGEKRPSSSLMDLLYEVNSDHVLIGTDLELDILSSTIPSTQRNTARYSLNGQMQNEIPRAHIREGQGYTVVYDQDHDVVVNVFSSALFLEPLDLAKYPNIFVNTHGKTRTSRSVLSVQSLLDDTYPNSTIRQGGSCKQIEMAVAFDNSFCDLFPTSAQASAFVQATVNFASSIYKRDLCHTLVLVHIEAHCNDKNDPYAYGSGTSSNSILNQFSSYWNANRASVHRDLAYLFTGFEDGTSVVGIASISAACGRAGYGWVELGSGPTFVHEVGHNLGARHTSEGIMRASSTKGDPVFFSDVSKNEINSYLGSSQASCINRDAPKCSSSCPGECVNGHCVALYDDTKPSGLVPCVPLQSLFKCTDSIQYFSQEYFFGEDCPARFGFMEPLETAPAKRQNVFCCEPPTDTSTSGVISADYPFIGLTLQGSGFLEFYIRNPSDIRDATLMNTKLVPSCKKSGGGQSNPSPSSSPKATKTATPSTTPTSSPIQISGPPSPSSSPASSPTPSQSSQTSEEGTCESALQSGQTIVCKRASGRINISGSVSARIGIVVEQRFGKFSMTLTAPNGVQLDQAAAKFSTLSSLEGNLGLKKLSGAERTEYKFSVDAFKFKSSGGCCGKRLYLFTKMRICRGNTCATTGVVRLSTSIRCGRPCGNKTILPFSSSRACPACE